MQKDFHFYIVYALARESGYEHEKAYIIAYSSQYVDDNTERYYRIEINGEPYEKKIEPIIGAGSKRFHMIITQLADINLANITKPLDFEVQRFIYAPFHFLPAEYRIAESEIRFMERKMGFYNPLTTHQDCENARELVEEAINLGDLYRIGISLHVYADTWAHSRFSGFQEHWNNALKTFDPLKLLPDIGHVELKHKPDIISHPDWTDERFGAPPVSNKEKALRASEGIFNFLSQGSGRKWTDTVNDFKTFVEAKDYSERISLILDKYTELQQYDEDLWVNEAFDFKLGEGGYYPLIDRVSGSPSETAETEVRTHSLYQVIETMPKENFEETNWYKFQVAAKKFLGKVFDKIEAI